MGKGSFLAQTLAAVSAHLCFPWTVVIDVGSPIIPRALLVIGFVLCLTRPGDGGHSGRAAQPVGWNPSNYSFSLIRLLIGSTARFRGLMIGISLPRAARPAICPLHLAQPFTRKLPERQLSHLSGAESAP